MASTKESNFFLEIKLSTAVIIIGLLGSSDEAIKEAVANAPPVSSSNL